MSRISHPLKIRCVLDNRKGLTLRVEGGLTINMSNELTLRANKDFGLLDDTQDIFQLLSLYWWSLTFVTCDTCWSIKLRDRECKCYNSSCHTRRSIYVCPWIFRSTQCQCVCVCPSVFCEYLNEISQIGRRFSTFSHSSGKSSSP